MSLSRVLGVVVLLAGGLAGCQSMPASPALPPLPAWQSPEGRGHAELGLIREMASGKALTPEQLLQRLAGVPRVLVGEQHDNPDHHALQLWLLRALEQQRPQGSLLLEMLEPAQQARVVAAKAERQRPRCLLRAPARWSRRALRAQAVTR